MRSFAHILTGLFRPGKALERAGDAVKWLWIPLAILLLASVLFKTAVSTPMKLEAQTAEAQAMFDEQIESMPEAERADYEKMNAEAEASGEMTEDEALNTAMQVTSIADIVFSALGALMAIGYTATFFFVAAKTWASPVKFPTMLTVAALSLLPQCHPQRDPGHLDGLNRHVAALQRARCARCAERPDAGAGSGLCRAFADRPVRGVGSGHPVRRTGL